MHSRIAVCLRNKGRRVTDFRLDFWYSARFGGGVGLSDNTAEM